MIGSALKKLAQENGMKVGHGIAYGNLQGFAASMSEGNGYKQITFVTRFTDPQMKDAFFQAVNGVNITREYRVKDLAVAANAIGVVFLDNPGTMKKIHAFLEWFIPLLRQYGATGMNTCAECGCEVASGRWVMINGIAYFMHDSCAQKAAQEIAGENEERKENAAGSYVTGLLGALAGSALGAVIWAIVLNAGYVASLVGFVIGWLAEKGYNLLKGKQGKAKVAILILAIIFGVLLGTVAADVFTLAGMISNGELPGFGIGDIPSMILLLLAEDAEYRGAVVGNILMGLLFAALGVFAMLRNAGKAVADTKVVFLD